MKNNLQNFLKTELAGKLKPIEADRKKKIMLMSAIKAGLIIAGFFMAIYLNADLLDFPLIGYFLLLSFFGSWLAFPWVYPMIFKKGTKHRNNTAAVLSVIAFISGVIEAVYFNNFSFVISASVSALVFYIIAHLAIIRPYRARFKKEIVAKAFSFYDPNVHYDPKGMVSRDEFVDSMLFEKEFFNKYMGEDLIKGNYKDTPFVMSELKVQYEETTTYTDNDGSIRTETETEDIFKGLFMVANLDTNIKGALVITYRQNTSNDLPLPKAVNNFFKSFERGSDRMGRLKRYDVKNKDIREDYDIYTSRGSLADNIITSEFINDLLQFNKYELWIMMSFIDDRFYLAAFLEEDLLEADIQSSVTNLKFLEEQISSYVTCLNSIEYLKIQELAKKA